MKKQNLKPIIEHHVNALIDDIISDHQRRTAHFMNSPTTTKHSEHPFIRGLVAYMEEQESREGLIFLTDEDQDLKNYFNKD